MDRVIEYSGETINRKLETALEKVNILQYNQEFRNALGEPLIERLSRWEKDIAACGKNPFTIAVVGNFKKGKSTMINALLGEEVAPTDVTTETVTLNRISYGPHSNTAMLKDGRSFKLGDQELKRERLEAAAAEAGTQVERLEIARPSPLLETITIIDTPGIGDSMRDFADTVRESLLQADAVIYVYDVQYPLSKSEQLFLKSAVLPQKYTRLFLVGNYGDALQTRDNYDRMSRLLKDRIGALLPDTETLIVSALDEFCRRAGEAFPENELTPLLREHFDALREQIRNLIDQRTEYVLTDRMQRMALNMAAEVSAELDAVEAGLRTDLAGAEQIRQDLQTEKAEHIRRHEKARERIRSALSGMKTEANKWMGSFMDRIREETGNLRQASEEDLKKYYEFYCIDLLQEAMTACVQTHQDQLLDLMDTIAGEVSDRLAVAFPSERRYSFRINLDNRIWTKGDTIGFVASRFAPQNYLMLFASFISDGITGAMRESRKKESVPELVDQIFIRLPALTGEVSRAISAAYQEMEDLAQGLLAEYFTEETERQEHLLEQTLQAASRTEEEKKAAWDAIGIARKMIQEISELSA